MDFISPKARKRQLNKRRTKELKEEFDAYKVARGCATCGYRENPVGLSFAHVSRDNKTASVAAMIRDGRAVEAIWREIAKCFILCLICHAIETQEESLGLR